MAGRCLKAEPDAINKQPSPPSQLERAPFLPCTTRLTLLHGHLMDKLLCVHSVLMTGLLMVRDRTEHRQQAPVVDQALVQWGDTALLQQHSLPLLPPPPTDSLLWNHEGWKRSLRLSRPTVNPSPPHPSAPRCWELGMLLQPGSSDISAGKGYEKPLINSLTH